MNLHSLEHLIQLIHDKSLPFSISDPTSYDNLLEKIHDARIVLIGEATHGTHEFYKARCELTKRLIEEKGFMGVAIEGDWPDAYQVTRFLKGMQGQEDVLEALNTFERFPSWMWRNKTVLPFLLWLRRHNDNIEATNQKVGLYGLDLYSLHASMQAVIEYLEKVDPKGAKEAKKRYGCFNHLAFDPETYGYLTSTGKKASCIQYAIEQFVAIQNKALDYLHKNGTTEEDEYFYATQNARLVRNAEQYYRAHFEGRVSSWNIRDQHMAETVHYLSNHLEKCFKKPSKIVIWAHNSHIGDARATEMGEEGELNLGQLMRETYAEKTYLIGFSTYEGFVRAADGWGGEGKEKAINPGMAGSYEHLFHQVPHKDFMLHLKQEEALAHFMQVSRLQRAIGVVYRPDTERYSHYFFTRLHQQFDTIIHLDKTTALMPLP